MNIPSSWQILPLQKVAKLQTGLALNSKLKILCPVCVPYLRVANVQAGHIELGDLKTVVIESSTMQRFVLHPGDVLLTEGGDFDKLGRGAVWRGQISPCLHQNHVFAIRTDRLKLLPEFLSYQTESNYGRNYFLSCSKQSTNLASINSTQIKNFPVIVPPLNEQRRIAEFLGTWNEAIEKLEQLIAAKEKRFSFLRVNMIQGKIRIVGFQSKWRKTVLSEISDHITRNVGTLDVEPASISAGKGFVLQKEKFGRNIAGKQYSRYTLLYPGEFTYNKGNSKTYECGCVYQWQGAKAVAVPNVFISFSLKPQQADARFISHFFEANLHANELRKFINSGVRNDGLLNITTGSFLGITIDLPELSEQRMIVNILNVHSLELELLRKELAALQKQKRGLMQKLLTGTWRV